MFRKTDEQQTLLSPAYLLDERKSKRLEGTWAHQWRTQILPHIDEEPFGRFYDRGKGAPNKPIRQKVSLLLFKHLFDLTDAQVVEQFEWNLLWHYALEVTPDRAGLERKTLSTYRRYLVELGGAEQLFRTVTDHLLELEGVKVDIQRIDSTHVMSDMRRLSQLGLFVETIAAFLRQLRRALPEEFESLDSELVGRYLHRGGYFADPARAEARRRLEQCATDALALFGEFEQVPAATALPHFESLRRLVDEQIEVTDSGTQVRPSVSGTAMRSPHDHDAEFGHKGVGYSVTVTETCDANNALNLATDVQVQPANETDGKTLEPALERLREHNLSPSTMLADAGYISAGNIATAQDQFGTDLVGPVKMGAKPKQDRLHLSDFVLDDDGIPMRCPAGHSRTQVASGKGGRVLVRFPRRHCQNCELAGQCPVLGKRIKVAGGRRAKLRRDPALSVTTDDLRVAKRRIRQETESFKKLYALRSGIEAQFGHLKNSHGMARISRVRGALGVRSAVFLKVLASNVRKWLKHALTNPAMGQPAPEPDPTRSHRSTSHRVSSPLWPVQIWWGPSWPRRWQAVG